MSKVEPEHGSRRETKESEPKKEESPGAEFLEIDRNWTDEEIKLHVKKWKEDSQKFVEQQFAVMRQKIKTSLDEIAYMVKQSETARSVSTRSRAKRSTRYPNRARSGVSRTEPTDEVGRRLNAGLQGIPKARRFEKRAQSLAPLVDEKLPEATLAQELESAGTLLKSPDDAEKSLGSVNWEAGEVKNASESSIMKTGDDENPSASATLVQEEVENRLESATLMQDEVENPSRSATLIPEAVGNPSGSATLRQHEVENPSGSATLIQDKVENPSASANMIAEVENPLALASFIQGEVENPLSSTTMIADEVENPSATNESDDAEKRMASASTEQNTTEDEASRSVNQTLFNLIKRLTSESGREVFKNIDSEELRLQLERFCRELGECTQKIGELQQSLEEKVVDSIEKNQTIVVLESFARDTLLVKGHSVPHTQEQTQNELDHLLKLVKEHIQPLKYNYDAILEDVVCCLDTKNKILDVVKKFSKLPFTEKRT